jgi:hypothetical protein
MHTRVVVTMEGGIIQDVSASDPSIVDVIVLDFDVEGVPSDELSVIERTETSGQACSASRWGEDGLTPLDEDVEQFCIEAFGEEQ